MARQQLLQQAEQDHCRGVGLPDAQQCRVRVCAQELTALQLPTKRDAVQQQVLISHNQAHSLQHRLIQTQAQRFRMMELQL